MPPADNVQYKKRYSSTPNPSPAFPLTHPLVTIVVIIAIMPSCKQLLAFFTLSSAILPVSASLNTWWHDKHAINTNGRVAPDEVRRSRRYNVSVSPAGREDFQDSFVYETIPRNGNGQMYDPAHPDGEQYDLADGDGISVEIDEGINMAWTQFEYDEDVDVRIVSTDGSSLGPASNVIVRPTHIQYDIESPQTDTVIIRVLYNTSGSRFSVEFQDDLYAYRSDGDGYISEGGLIVSEEPRNALLVFASPFIDDSLIPTKTSSDTQVFTPGKLTEDAFGSQPTLYFEAGVYWMEENGTFGTSRIKLSPSTHYVYLEPGTYIKGALEYTTSNDNFYTIGHGVLSGEHYTYQANTIKNYVADKDDRYSLRMIWHQSVLDSQTYHCVGLTLNSPPFNSMDLQPKDHTPHEEDNKVSSHISDYKQVGAFYFQTDGTQMYRGTVRDAFWHINDDAIKLYHSGADIDGIVIWKARNNAVIQVGWKSRDVEDVTVRNVRLIHNRWVAPDAYVPSAILGSSPFYDSAPEVDALKTMNLFLTDFTCEGRCAALLTIAPLQNFNVTMRNIHFESIFEDDKIALGRSAVGMNISERVNNYIPGQEKLTMGLHIQNWTIGGAKVDMTNWEADQLGQLDIHPDFYGDWTIE